MGALGLARGLATPQVLDLLFAFLSFGLFALYHAWYYSWHLWLGASDAWAPLEGRGQGARAALRRRVDLTGQNARHLFTLVPGSLAGGQAVGPSWWAANGASRGLASKQRPWRRRPAPALQAVLSTGTDADYNLAVQTMRCAPAWAALAPRHR